MMIGVLIFALSAAAGANPVHTKLERMTQTKRKAVLAEAINDAGKQCIGVKRAVYQGSDENDNAVWSARCVDGRLFAVQINNDADGSTSVLRCKARKRGAGGKCFANVKTKT